MNQKQIDDFLKNNWHNCDYKCKKCNGDTLKRGDRNEWICKNCDEWRLIYDKPKKI